MKVETRRQGITLSDLNWELVCQAAQFFFAILCMSVTDQSAMNIGFWITNKFYSVGKFASTESINNEHQLFCVPCTV